MSRSLGIGWVATALLPGLLLLGIYACGGDSSSSSTGTNSSSTTPTSPTPTSPTPTSPTPTGTPVACQSGQRKLDVLNDTNQPVWVGGGGGALRAVCVVGGGASSCLTNNYDGTTGACGCADPGPQNGTLACPGSSNATGAVAGGKNCQCTKDSDCGTGAGCNTNTKLCYFTLPAPAGFQGFTPSNSWNWELPANGDAVSFCLDRANVTYNSTSIASAVWWSGGVGARTGCKNDGTDCQTGDCSALSDSNCSAGVGLNTPSTLAEFTLQSTDNDFYDVTVINGANIGEQMAPIPAPTQTPGSVAPAYWCATPGGGCKFNFGNYTRAVPPSSTDYTTLLMLTSQPCKVGSPTQGCPSDNYTCNGAPTGALNGTCVQSCTSTSQCTAGLQCLPAGDGNSYCQCTAQSDCGTGKFCGTQFIPGLGNPSSPQLYLQQCGSFAGWWTADDLCSNSDNNIYLSGTHVFDCSAAITDGDGSMTDIASLFGCNDAGPNANPANKTSCYNSAAATAGCCGCATDSSNPLASLWPTTTVSCGSNNSTWASSVQPWLANLKQACPTAYSYPFDDPTSTFQCREQGTTNLLGYTVEFTSLPTPSSE